MVFIKCQKYYVLDFFWISVLQVLCRLYGSGLLKLYCSVLCCRACVVVSPGGRPLQLVGDCAVFLHSTSWRHHHWPLQTCSLHLAITLRYLCRRFLSRSTGTVMDQVSAKLHQSCISVKTLILILC